MPAANYPKVYLYRRIVQAKLYIDKNYAEPIDLHNISDEASFSRFHFIRLFKQAYGKTPHQYLIWVRLEKAKELLKLGKAVTDVCFEVGFESPGSFSSLFKRVIGETASAYLQRQQKIQAEMQQAPLNFVPGCFSLPSKKAIFEKLPSL